MSNKSSFPRRLFLKGVGAVAGTSAVGLSAADATRETQQTTPPKANEADTNLDAVPEVVAHRGFAGIHPENTIGGEMAAVRDGADALDIDIMPCADGTPVAFHDATLDRLTTLEGPVGEASCAKVVGAEVLDSGQTVSALEDMLKVIPPSMPIQLEFKNPGPVELRPNEDISGATLDTQKRLWRPFTLRVLDMLDEDDHDVLIAASREAALATVREADPSIPIAFYFSDSVEVGLDITRQYDCEVIYPPVNMINRTPMFNSPDYYVKDPDFADIDLVTTAHDEGREIYVFTVTSWHEADQLRKAGVDGILSNLPRLYSYDYANASVVETDDANDQYDGPGDDDDGDNVDNDSDGFVDEDDEDLDDDDDADGNNRDDDGDGAIDEDDEN